MTIKLLTFLLKYKLFGSANQEVADYQSSLALILRMRIRAMTIEHPTSMTKNLDNFGFRYVLSKYPGVINLPAELVPWHGASRMRMTPYFLVAGTVLTTVNCNGYGTRWRVGRFNYWNR